MNLRTAEARQSPTLEPCTIRGHWIESPVDRPVVRASLSRRICVLARWERIPASHCGIVGLKPTYGRVSTRGVMTLSWTLDHVGPMCKSVEDAALMLKIIAGYDELEPTTEDAPVHDYA